MNESFIHNAGKETSKSSRQAVELVPDGDVEGGALIRSIHLFYSRDLLCGGTRVGGEFRVNLLCVLLVNNAEAAIKVGGNDISANIV